MENPAKMPKLESCQDQKSSVSEGTCIFDEIPDEVLEMIISYVPVKSSCFLVNKRFNKEANNSTRNRCCLLLDDRLVCHSRIMNYHSILQTGRNFDEICLNYSEFNLSLNNHSYLLTTIINRFGSSIKKFSIKAWDDDKFFEGKDFIPILGLMQNLEHLDLCTFNSTTIKITIKMTTECENLKSLKSSDSKLLNLFTCPSLEKLVVDWANNDTVSFVQRHTHLKQLSFFDAMSNANLNTLQGILSIEGLKLNSLEVKSFLDSQVSHRLPFCSALEKQDELKTLKLMGYFINDQVLHCIVRLTKLETLSINLYFDNMEPIHIADIHQVLSQLRVLKICANRFDLFEALSTVENPRMKELSFTLSGYNFRQQPPTVEQHSTLQSFAENLPNLNKAVLKGFNSTAVLNMTTHLKNLENLEFDKNWRDNINIEKVTMAPPNLKIRELFLGFHNARSEKVIEAFVKLAPNVTKLVYDPGYFYHVNTPGHAFHNCPWWNAALNPVIGHDFYFENVMNLGDLASILKLTQLTEFHAPVDFLVKRETVALIKEHGKQIKKIISKAHGDKFQKFLLRYRSEFPFHIIKRTDVKYVQELVMMRN